MPLPKGLFHLILLHASLCPNPPSYAAVNENLNNAGVSALF